MNTSATPVIHANEDDASSRPPYAATDRATIVIFGATGDLTWRKIIPALYELHNRNLLPEGYAIVGYARREKSDDEFRNEVSKAIEDRSRWDEFSRRVYYHQADIADADGYVSLAEHLAVVEARHNLPGNRLFYLSVSPDHFSTILRNLKEAGLISNPRSRNWTRVVIEKPFGHDLDSARELNKEVSEVLHEDQVYRIDHYLGKETVQNVLSFRFGNAIFEPLFNRRYIDHVQISVSETLGMEGRRGAYYDKAGAMRDMVQNHVLQVLCLIAMEPPASMTAKDIRDEKVKVLRSLVRMSLAQISKNVVRGQYRGADSNNERIPAYREEEGVALDSNTETFVAMRVQIDNWRWAGVPFFLRTGKRMPKRATEIAIQFRHPPMQLFTTVECVGDECDITGARPNVLVFEIQPDDVISLTLSAKRPGPQWQLQPVQMRFDFGGSYHRKLPEAYERLLLDVLRGDSTLFTRADEVESAWEFITPIHQVWEKHPPADFPNYSPGSWGPAEANSLLAGTQGEWRRL